MASNYTISSFFYVVCGLWAEWRQRKPWMGSGWNSLKAFLLCCGDIRIQFSMSKALSFIWELNEILFMIFERMKKRNSLKASKKFMRVKVLLESFHQISNFINIPKSLQSFKLFIFLPTNSTKFLIHHHSLTPPQFHNFFLNFPSSSLYYISRSNAHNKNYSKLDRNKYRKKWKRERNILFFV